LELNFNLDKLFNVQNEQLPDYNQPLINELEKLPTETNVPGPNNPPWNSGIALLMWFVSIALILIIPTIGVLIYLVAKQTDFTDSKKLAESISGDTNAILVNIICVIPAHILTIFLAWLIVTRIRKHSFREMLGWQMGGFKLVYLIAIVIGFFFLAAGVSYLIPEQENDLLRILKSSRAVAIVVALMATFTAPLVEEVVYRGVLYSAFQRTLGVAPAVVLVTFLFALVHVPQYYPSFSSIIMICLLSLTLTLVRVKSNNLLPCIVLHTIFNGVQSVLIIAQPYLEKYTTDPASQPSIFFWLN
jgi:membrane protease YdiL (CAAX protease family)